MGQGLGKGPLRSVPGFLEVLRVHQLDALYFDEEITELLFAKLTRIFSFFRADFLDVYKPEITGILHSVLFYLSVWSSDRTYGQLMQNLTYSDARVHTLGRGGVSTSPPTFLQKSLLFIFTVGLGWVVARFSRRAANENWADLPSDDWRCKAWHFVRRVESFVKILNLFNFIAFLYDGKYVTLTTRILRLRLVYLRAHQRPRFVNFDFLNRQLVWQGFMEFFIFLFPLINLASIGTTIKYALTRLFSASTSSLLDDPTSPASSHYPSSDLSPSLASLPLCPLCHDTLSTPHCADCGHTFCYYCLATARLEEPAFSCPLCATAVTSSRPLRP